MRIGKLVFDKPPLIAAPMEDISDPPFRRLCRRLGADLVFTEFISSEGLIREAGKSLKKLDIYEDERPVVVQIFGHNVESMVTAAGIAVESEPDMIDLNFGCPVRKVVSKGAGAALLQDLPRMAAIARAVVERSPVPVSAKTRLGWDHNSLNIMEAAERLQDAGISMLTIHGRTRSQLYGGQADWTLIGAVRNNPGIHIPIIGNGDIDSGEKAAGMLNRYGVDGLMIGRAMIGYPFIFREIKAYLEEGRMMAPASMAERLELCRELLDLAVEWKGERVALYETRKHYGRLFKGLHHTKPLKMRLMEATTAAEVRAVLDEAAGQYDQA
ncbi:MAG TPA: tRNA dihydrouridine synthase DusB [Bacteroidales bacterium]|nr:tRNA dihydrouridine synthase DusB [Bacteroidales bacterium]